MDTADLILEVHDITRGFSRPFCHSSKTKILTVATKTDLTRHSSTSDDSQRNYIETSAKTGDGIQNLIDRIIRTLVPVSPNQDDAVVLSLDQLARMKELRKAVELDRRQEAIVRIDNLLQAAEKVEVR